MGYIHIDNLYKNKSILLFKECYALEKIHGTSSRITWNGKKQSLSFFTNGKDHTMYVNLFDKDKLTTLFFDIFKFSTCVIYGEQYGGNEQGMQDTYGIENKFIAFDVKIDDKFLNVSSANKICDKLELEFVDYVLISTDLEKLNFERDKPSTQAKRNGILENKIREGVILRPLEECIIGDKRVIVKHKRNEFIETKTPREVNFNDFNVLENAEEIAEEWVTENRLEHVLQKISLNLNISHIKIVIDEMIKDIYREADGEIIKNKEVSRQIGIKTAIMFKKLL